MRFREFIIFYVLCFLLLGLIPLLSAIFNDGSMDFAVAGNNASKVTGLVWTSNLFDVLRLSLVEPILLLTVLGSAVPALAAVCTLLYIGKRAQWRLFFARFLPFRNIDPLKALTTYTGIFLLLIPCLFVVLLLRQITGGEYQSGVNLSFALVPSILAVAFLDQGALLEELGWRGFAAPLLQNGGIQPLRAAIIIGLCWGLWHLPRDLTTGVIERLGFLSYLGLFLPAFVLGTIAVSIIAMFFVNRLGGSVIPAIVVHGITNDAIGLSGTASIIDALTPYHQISKSLPFAIIAIAIVIYSGPLLGFSSKEGNSTANEQT